MIVIECEWRGEGRVVWLCSKLTGDRIAKVSEHERQFWWRRESAGCMTLIPDATTLEEAKAAVLKELGAKEVRV